MSCDFRVEFRKTGEVVVVDVRGEVDIQNQQRFERAVVSGLARGAVVVDLSQMTFLAISALRCMSRCQRTALRMRRPLVFAAAPAPVTRLLSVAGMDEELPMADSVASGLETIQLDAMWRR